VETPCELDGWVSTRDVTLDPPAAKTASSLRGATIVIDPGHGGLDSGAVGPKGLMEKAVNLDIARRLSSMLAPARILFTRNGDYYHVLRTSGPPAVIVEGLYISNPPEEALLARPDVRDLMARALARAINRYLTTRDPGSGFVLKPLPRVSGPVFHTPSACHDP